jgi:hypothetical protein
MEEGVVHLRDCVDVFVYGVGQVAQGVVVGHLQTITSCGRLLVSAEIRNSDLWTRLSCQFFSIAINPGMHNGVQIYVHQRAYF